MYLMRMRPRTPEHSVESMRSRVAEYAEWEVDGRSQEKRPWLGVGIAWRAGSGMGSGVSSGVSSMGFGGFALGSAGKGECLVVWLRLVALLILSGERG